MDLEWFMTVGDERVQSARAIGVKGDFPPGSNRRNVFEGAGGVHQVMGSALFPVNQDALDPALTERRERQGSQLAPSREQQHAVVGMYRESQNLADSKPSQR